MPPKKKQKLIKGQSFILFGRPNEQTEDKVDKSDQGPLCVEIQCTSVYVDQV